MKYEKKNIDFLYHQFIRVSKRLWKNGVDHWWILKSRDLASPCDTHCSSSGLLTAVNILVHMRVDTRLVSVFFRHCGFGEESTEQFLDYLIEIDVAFDDNRHNR